jgi:hypothetical protein
MTERNDSRMLPGQGRGTRWLQRALLAALAVGLAITAVFFLVFAVIAGAALALVIGIRFWWVMRRLRAQAKATEALEGEYTVVEGARTTERLER